VLLKAHNLTVRKPDAGYFSARNHHATTTTLDATGIKLGNLERAEQGIKRLT